MRFRNSPELFGVGVGTGTIAHIKCDVCGKEYHEDEKENNGDCDLKNDSVGNTVFAEMTVCDCCFERIEEEIWRRRKDVLVWLKEKIESIRESVKEDLKIIEEQRREEHENS